MDRTSYEVGDSEVETLLYYLDKSRKHVVATTAGLTDRQLRTAGVPSGTSLRWLIEHLIGVEQHWFRTVFLGEDPVVDDHLTPTDAMSYDELVAGYHAVCQRNNEIARACPDLSTMSRIANPGEPERDSLRAVIGHMIEETAQHAGHADILRELLDQSPTAIAP